MRSTNSKWKLFSFSKFSKAGNRNQTRQLCKCNSRFETRTPSCFVDFRQYANAFKLFGTPLQTNVEEVEEKYQLELIDLQCDEFLKARYDSVTTVEFYQRYVAPRKKFPNHLQNAKIMTSLFASTYCCEQLFSKMKYTKS